MAIDYADIGRRIKQKRIEKNLTQEKLSEMVKIGPSHMSHIESGSAAASFEVFVAIINALECSADEILLRETISSKQMTLNWITELVEDCDQTEIKIISDLIVAAKQTLRKNKTCE